MKIKRLLRIPILFAALLLSQPALAADADDYAAALNKARESLNATVGQAQLWTTSDVLLEKAEAAAAEGLFDQAIAYANEAGIHAELALATAVKEKKVWRNGVPK